MDVSDRFDFSYFALETDNQRTLLQLMAAFASSTTEEAIIAVCDKLIDSSKCSDDLNELAKKSLVEYQEDSGRYQLHPLMRQYAAAKAGMDAMDMYRGKTAKYFLDYASNFRKNFDMLELERENLLSGMDWAVARQKFASGAELKAAPSIVIPFILALFDFLIKRGYWNECGLYINHAIDAAELLDDGELSALLTQAQGILYRYTGRYAEAAELFKSSKAISKNLADEGAMALSLLELGNLAYLTSDMDSAKSFYRQTLDIAQRIPDNAIASRAIQGLSILALHSGDCNEARKLSKQSLEIAQMLGDNSDISRSLHQLGTIAQSMGDYNEARKLLQQSLEIDQDLGDKSGIALSQAQLANLEEEAGNIREALRLIRIADRAFQDLRSPYAEKTRQDKERLEGKS